MVYDEIDPFSDMLVEVSGTVPFIKLEYPDISGDPFLMENVKYEAAKTDGLSNGDVSGEHAAHCHRQQDGFESR